MVSTRTTSHLGRLPPEVLSMIFQEIYTEQQGNIGPYDQRLSKTDIKQRNRTMFVLTQVSKAWRAILLSTAFGSHGFHETSSHLFYCWRRSNDGIEYEDYDYFKSSKLSRKYRGLWW